MSNSVLKYTVSFLVIFIMAINSNAQNFFSNGLNFGVKGGASSLLMEVPNDFSRKFIEFDNKFGFAIDAELSKYLTNHWEVAAEVNYTVLNGETQNPSFSAEGNHAAFIEPITEPVEYNNILTGSNIFFRYYLISLSKQDGKVNMYPFISAGLGLLNYTSTFKYIDSNDGGVRFGKNINEFPSKLSTAVFKIGGGIKTSLSSKVYMIASIDAKLVPYGFLDVVHNYDNEGNKLDIIGTYVEIKVGIFYSLTPFTPGKGRNKKSPGQEHLPFGK